MLSYYRNGLMHIFIQEAILAVSLLSFVHQYNIANQRTPTNDELTKLDNLNEGKPIAIPVEKGVPIELLWEEFKFLMKLLNEEFITRNRIDSMEAFEALID
jgi:hypothetical protein